MKEIQIKQIQVIEVSRERDYCIVPRFQYVTKIMVQILDLEKQIKEKDISRDEWDRLAVAHMRHWNNLPDYYKGMLSDLTAIEMQL